MLQPDVILLPSRESHPDIAARDFLSIENNALNGEKPSKRAQLPNLRTFNIYAIEILFEHRACVVTSARYPELHRLAGKDHTTPQYFAR